MHRRLCQERIRFGNKTQYSQFKGYGNGLSKGGVTFPYANISKYERDESYEKLSNLNFGPNDKLTLSSVGNKASNYYFETYRMKTKTGKWSHYARWQDLRERKKIIETDKKIHKNTPKLIGTASGLRSALSMSAQSVVQFKPYVAVYVYQKFKPKRILDISAGWGDRLIGAMSQNIDYVGIDSNKRLKIPYGRMIKDFRDKTKSKVMMIFDRSENINYSKLPKYDLIFTSPPYFSLEQYEGMKQYENNEDFADSYFIPTVTQAWKYLSMGGILALNMPAEMYELLKMRVPMLGKVKIIKMPIQNRFSFKGDNEKKYESIYWWVKNRG